MERKSGYLTLNDDIYLETQAWQSEWLELAGAINSPAGCRSHRVKAMAAAVLEIRRRLYRCRQSGVLVTAGERRRRA
jgi:hypothetical protein